MLLQRVLETVEEFDLSFPPPSPRDNIISNQSHPMMGGYQPITFNNNNSSNTNGNNNASSHTPTPTTSAELRAIEQQLIAIHPSALLSDKGVAEAKAALMELLIERIKAVSIAALRKVDAGAAETRVMPSRVSGFTTLIKYVMEIAERKRAWEGRVRHIHQNMSSAEQNGVGGYGEENTSGFQQGAGGYRGMVPSPPPASGLSGGGLSPTRTPLATAAASAASQQHPPVTLLDLALNEPTVSEIQSLIAEQRQLQATLKQLLEPAMGGGGNHHVTAGLLGSARMSGSSGTKQIPTPLQSSLGIAVGANSVTPFSLGSIGASAAAATKRGSLIGADPAIHETMPPTANATPRPSDITVDPSSAGPFSPTPRTSGGGGGGGAKAPGGKRGAGRSGSLSGSVGLSRGASAGGYGHHNAGAFDSARAQQTEAQLKQKTADLHAANDKCDELKKELAAMRRAKEEAERELSALKATEIAQFLEYESEWSIRSKVAAVAFGPIGGGNLPFAAGEGGNTNGSFGAAASPTSTAAPPSPASALTGIAGGGFGFGVAATPSSQQQQRSTSASALRKQHSVSSMNVADLLQMSSNNNNSAAATAAHSTEPLPNRLMAFGIPPEMLVAPHVPEAESAVIVSKIQQIFIDAAAFVADSATNAKGRKTLKTLQDEAAAAQSRQQALVAGSAADRQQFLLGLVGHAGCYGGGHVTATSSFGSEGGGGAVTSRNGHRGGGGANTRGGPLSADSSAAMTPRIAGGSGGPRGGGASTFSAPSSSSPSSGGGGNCADPMLSNALAAIGAPTAPAALIPLLPRSEALDGAAWAALYRQNTIIRRLCDKLDEAEAARRGVEADAEAEAARLQRIVRTLEERVSAHKATNARLSQRHEQLQYEFEERNRPQHEDEDDDENDGGTDVNNSIDGGGGPDSAATTVAGGGGIGSIVKKKKKLFTTAADKVRIVQTKNQPMTAAERERDLHRALLAKDKKIENITDQLRASKHDIDDKAAEIASMGRERLSLLSKCAEESLKVQTLQKQLEEAYAVKQASQDSALTMKRELREKSALEADNAQKLWKSQVELHISHNVIAELRKREQQLLDDLDDAVEQRRILRDQHLSKSTENRKMQTLFELQLQEARAAVDTAKEALYAERQQTLANEKEMERLRVVDVQLETMEQNFNNYAASMIVKREAGEEEERVLGECLEQIQQDVFSLPNEAAMGEEQLTLLLAKLSHRKEVLENESRLNRQAEKALSERKRMLMAQQSVNGGGGGNNGHPNLRDGPTAEDEEKAAIATAEEQLTNKKRLGLLLQRRYNDVQIFACERRLAEVRRGMQLRETMTELTSIQHIHEAMLKELSQTRSQLDAMAQRNSELEVERKQLLRDRERDEGQNKRLQAQVQRLNVTSEAQEGMLVDLGTKLQHEKILSSSPPRGANALTSRTLQQSNNGGRGIMNASQNSQMTITSQTGPGGLAVSTFGGGELDHFGMTSNASTSGASGGIPTPTATVVGGLHNGQNGYTFTKDGKKQYNIAPLGPVL